MAYDAAKLKDGPTTIADLFDLKKYPGKRALQKSPFVNLEFALMGGRGCRAIRSTRC